MAPTHKWNQWIHSFCLAVWSLLDLAYPVLAFPLERQRSRRKWFTSLPSRGEWMGMRKEEVPHSCHSIRSDICVPFSKPMKISDFLPAKWCRWNWFKYVRQTLHCVRSFWDVSENPALSIAPGFQRTWRFSPHPSPTHGFRRLNKAWLCSKWLATEAGKDLKWF